jgi:hypothetical protein
MYFGFEILSFTNILDDKFRAKRGALNPPLHILVFQFNRLTNLNFQELQVKAIPMILL